MDNALLPAESNENRSARMSVLTWHPKEGEALNLFTHIRHRQGDSMGPWAGEPDHIWHTTEFPAGETGGAGEIRIHRLDAPLTHCLQLVEDILVQNSLVAGDYEVRYALEQPPRIHWAHRNHTRPDDHSVSSPFTKHSAKIIEYWSFAPEPRGILAEGIRILYVAPTGTSPGQLGFSTRPTTGPSRKSDDCRGRRMRLTANS